MLPEIIVYEEPANDVIKTCLRLERLISQAQQTVQKPNDWCSHQTLLAIFDLLKLLDRTDIKAAIAKELQRTLTVLLPLAKSNSINQQKLETVLGELERMIDRLRDSKGKFAQALYDNEFLKFIATQMQYPATAVSFDTPAYYYWLHQPSAKRLADLHAWLQEFDLVREATNVLLKLLRETNTSKIHTAEKGNYQLILTASLPCQLMRIGLPSTTHAFPKISISRQRVHIQFYLPSTHKPPTQVTDDVSFELTCCGL